MTDKVQKIREEVQRLMNELIQEKEKGFGSDADDACILELLNVLTYINSLQEEPVSEELEEAAKHYLYSNILYDDVYVGNPTDKDCIEMFKAGANWKREQIAKENMLLPFKEYDNLMEFINKRKKEGYEAGYKQGLVDSKSE